MRNLLLVILCVGSASGLFIGGPQEVSAAISAIGATSSTGFPVSSTDLLEGLLPTGTAGIHDENGLGTDTTGASLTNGSFGPPGLTGPPNSEVALVHSGTLLTYTLSPSPFGHDLTGIDTYAGWSDSTHADQNYQVLIATIANPTFTLLTTINYTSDGGTPTDTLVNVTAVPSGAMASHVTGIEFLFAQVQNGYVGYRELDVYGGLSVSAPVPEPASCVLFCLGVAGLLIAARRHATWYLRLRAYPRTAGD